MDLAVALCPREGRIAARGPQGRRGNRFHLSWRLGRCWDRDGGAGAPACRSLAERGKTLVQKKPTMYPEWKSSFDAHIYEGRVIQIVLMRAAEEPVSEVTVGVSVLAERCKKNNGKAEFWVRAVGNMGVCVCVCVCVLRPGERRTTSQSVQLWLESVEGEASGSPLPQSHCPLSKQPPKLVVEADRGNRGRLYAPVPDHFPPRAAHCPSSFWNLSKHSEPRQASETTRLS